MIAPIRTFISYQQPVRCRRTAMEIVATFAVSGLGFTVAALSLRPSAVDPKFIALIALLIGIVAFVIGCALLWSFAIGRTHEVHITDEGVRYDGKKWSWASVISIRSTTVLPNGSVYLSIRVQRGPLRSRLTLPIEVRCNTPIETINELKRYLSNTGCTIPWHSNAA